MSKAMSLRQEGLLWGQSSICREEIQSVHTQRLHSAPLMEANLKERGPRVYQNWQVVVKVLLLGWSLTLVITILFQINFFSTHYCCRIHKLSEDICKREKIAQLKFKVISLLEGTNSVEVQQTWLCFLGIAIYWLCAFGLVTWPPRWTSVSTSMKFK